MLPARLRLPAPAEDLIHEAVAAAVSQRLVKPLQYVVVMKSVRGNMMVKVVQVNGDGACTCSTSLLLLVCGSLTVVRGGWVALRRLCGVVVGWASSPSTDVCCPAGAPDAIKQAPAFGR